MSRKRQRRRTNRRKRGRGDGREERRKERKKREPQGKKKSTFCTTGTFLKKQCPGAREMARGLQARTALQKT